MNDIQTLIGYQGLKWKEDNPHYFEAILMFNNDPDDFARFGISICPTCYRRGPYRLLIEICGNENHIKWGCFDDQDQPTRYYHDLRNAISECELIARVLLIDRTKYGLEHDGQDIHDHLNNVR